jgi:hypothetical protein
MPEIVKPRFSFGQLVRRGIPAGIILVLIALFALNMLIVWDLNRTAKRVDKVAQDVEAEAQAANPVGSTRQQVEDWLKANNFRNSALIADKWRMDGWLTMFNISAKDVTSLIESHRPIGGGKLGERVDIYFFFGPDEKLIAVSARGFFISL